jgi:SAM-dependent methyltransferase
VSDVAAHSSDRRATAVRGEAIHHVRASCRACGGRALAPVLSLGPQPLANALPADPTEFAGERAFPLDLVFCEECALVQIVDVIDPTVLFDHYLYVTGTSETIARHNDQYAETVLGLLGGDPARAHIVEVASNDGSLLLRFAERGARVLGVEPARNIAALAEDRGIPTVTRFFDSVAADDLRAGFGPADAVIANNVLAHVDEPADFLRGCQALVSPHGYVVVEVPTAQDMLQRLEYDTIYHEHLSYFALAPLSRLAAQAGLRIARVDRVSVHGGSMRVYFQHGSGDAAEIGVPLAAERAAGVTTLAAWQSFARLAERNRVLLRDLIEREVASGVRLAGYGAPAKGNTLLNFCRIGPDLVPFTVDRNPLKVGRYTPGMHLPVRNVDELEAFRPDLILLLAWNFADEVRQQQAAHSARGGRWIIPIPTPHVT